MTKLIFYFSGTGNSKYLAKKLAGNKAIISIAEAVYTQQFEYDVEPGQTVGFVFPIYFWGYPSIVEEFLGKVSLKGYNNESNPIFMAASCGGSTGLTDKMVAKILSSRGYKLNGAYSVKMPDNYIIMYDLLTPEKDIDPILRLADLRMEDIIKDVNSLTPSSRVNRSMITRGFFPWLATAFSYPIYRNGRKTAPFWAGDECIGCGICEKICPSHTIKMVKKEINLPELKEAMRPVWIAPQCIQCLACLHHCPVRTIQYGNKTSKRGRYVNPKIK